MREQTVTVWQGKVRLRVRSDGRGPALVFLHGAWGVTWDAFLGELAQAFTVHAPDHPGTSPEAPDDIYQLDNLWDLVLCYDELLTALKLDEAVLVGHSFGGMVACELAAASPRRARRLVLIDPIGFWRESEPVVNWMTVNPAELPAYVFRDPTSEPAQRMFASTDPADRVRLMWSMGATGKFIWPIPDKGLKKRIHRVSAPTLVVWGKEDRLVPAVYADEFTRRIAGARVQTVEGTGHAPHLEQPERVARMVREFAG
jgi:pimeloyl-ACP methyl ester carboxylesterase